MLLLVFLLDLDVEPPFCLLDQIGDGVGFELSDELDEGPAKVSPPHQGLTSGLDKAEGLRDERGRDPGKDHIPVVYLLPELSKP